MRNERDISEIERFEYLADKLSSKKILESEFVFYTSINDQEELQRAQTAATSMLQEIANNASLESREAFKITVCPSENDPEQGTFMGQFLGFVANNPYWPYIEIEFGEDEPTLETFEAFAATIQQLTDKERQQTEMAGRANRERLVTMFLDDLSMEEIARQEEQVTSRPANHVTLYFEDADLTENEGTVLSARGKEIYIAALALCLEGPMQISLKLNDGSNSCYARLNPEIASVFATRPPEYQQTLHFAIDRFAINEEFLEDLGVATAKTAEVTLDFNGSRIEGDFIDYISAIQNTSSNLNKALTIEFNEVKIGNRVADVVEIYSGIAEALAALIATMRDDQQLTIYFYDRKLDASTAEQLFANFNAVTQDSTLRNFSITVGRHKNVHPFIEHDHPMHGPKEASSIETGSPAQSQCRLFAFAERPDVNAEESKRRADEGVSEAPTP